MPAEPAGNRRPDVLVVGAGVAGLWSAYFLRRAGCAVTVVERTVVGDPGACSSGNTGFMAHGGGPLIDAKPLHAGLATLALPGAGRWLRQLASARAAAPQGRAVLAAMKHRSIEILAQLAQHHAPMRTASFPGLIVAFRTDQGFSSARASIPAGVPARILDASQLQEIEPNTHFTVAGAIQQESGAAVDVPDFLVDLAGILRNKGVDFREHTEVIGFSTQGGRVTAVRTTAGDLSAGHVVLAAGVRTSRYARILGERLALAPLKGYSVTLPAPPGTPSRPLLLGEDTIAMRPMGALLRLAGGMKLSSGRTASAGDVARLLGAVTAYLPSLSLHGARDVWTGLRPATPDSLPYLGRTARYANVSLACGYGHVGMGLAPISGKLVAQQILDETSDMDMHPFRNTRFADHER
jgi:D-amino-acid dehydrogenase